MRDRNFNAYEVGQLIDRGGMVLTGRTCWSRHTKRVRCSWVLDGGNLEFTYRLEFGISAAAPAHYTIGWRVEGDPLAVRLDVRGLHRQPDGELLGATHLQDVRHRADEGWALEPPPDPPFSVARIPEVTEGEYFENLMAFCEYMDIGVIDFEWTDPPLDQMDQLPMMGGE